MRLTYKQVSDRKLDDANTRVVTAAKVTNSLQEDNAFMNKLNRIRFNQFHESEIKRIWKIALMGIRFRQRLEKAIAKSRIDGNEELYEQLKEFKKGAY